ncbi:phage minor head protein [Natroniella sp. ANB-PHB2]|uniref:phage minor head protein n=1 Tax=Natroniella sp. ANB-PHB2 TaxID=3384444 RepID=UPI0038D41BEA
MSSATVRRKRLSRYSQRLALQEKKRFAGVFEWLARKIENDNSDKFADGFEVDYDGFSERMKNSLLRSYEKTSYRFSDYISKLFNFDLDNDEIRAVANQAVREYSQKHAAKKVQSITETTRELINNLVTKQQQEGRNIRVIANNLVERVEDMSDARAMTIARTETSINLSNTNNLTASKAGMKKKTWRHVGAGQDHRENHKALDGKTVKIHEPFDLGNGITAMYPHDPELPPGEVINCYCIVTYS